MNKIIGETDSSIEFRRFSSDWKLPLAVFLQALDNNGDSRYFHPHPFSDDFLDLLCKYQGKDLYYLAVEGNIILAYGMLRGWDEGYKVPSLGIAVHPKFRGIGLSKAFMHFLHIAARRKGALQIRLKVYPENVEAIKLYEDLGYVFREMENQQLVGRLNFK